MSGFPLWAHRLFNAPLAIDRFKNDVLIEFAQLRLAGAKPDHVTATTLDAAHMQALARDARRHTGGDFKPFGMDGRIAVIPVRGTLVQRAGYVDAESGLLGYDKLVSTCRAASNDPDVGGIWMPYDSCGGEFAGMMSAAEEIASMTKAEGGKPIYAFIDERACSAAYGLASVSDKVFGRRECQGASISAIINIIDSSKAYEKAGLEPIQIRPEWADRKARGGPGEKIDADTIAKLSAIVDEASMMFVELVAAMRGISEKSIMALRGEVFTGNDMLKHGLIDEITSEQEAWSMLEDDIRAN